MLPTVDSAAFDAVVQRVDDEITELNALYSGVDENLKIKPDFIKRFGKKSGADSKPMPDKPTDESGVAIPQAEGTQKKAIDVNSPQEYGAKVNNVIQTGMNRINELTSRSGLWATQSSVS